MTRPEVTSNPDVAVVLDDLRRIVRALRESSRTAEREIGISGAQLFVLRTLLRRGRPVSLNALAGFTKTHQSSVSVVVAKLVERKLVSRSKSELDGRRLDIALTDKGRDLLERAPPAVQDRLFKGLEQLPAQKCHALAQGLRSLVQSMQLDDEPPTMFLESDDEPPPARRRKKRS